MKLALVLCLGVSAAAGAQVITGTIGSGGGGGYFASATGKPLSWEIERTTVQTLADGTHLTRTTHQRFVGDSMGRTRMESDFPVEPGGKMQVRVVNVMDPVAGESYGWQEGTPAPKKYTVQKIQVRQPGAAAGPVPVPPAAAAGQIQIVPPPPVLAQPERKVEQLGSSSVQGEACVATKTTIVYPVGYWGNDRPITTVRETCMSREFGQAVLEHSDDPRSGVTDGKLTSVSRTEPMAGMFMPPADYTPQEMGGAR